MGVEPDVVLFYEDEFNRVIHSFFQDGNLDNLRDQIEVFITVIQLYIFHERHCM